MVRRINRRTIVVATLATTGLGIATSNVRAEVATPDASPVSAASDSPLSASLPTGGVQTDGTWIFTDDRGVTITLPEAPTKVVTFVGYAAALYDLGYEVAGYYGGSTNADGTPATIAGNLPLDRIPSVAADGDDYSVDVEKLVGLGADLIVGPNYAIAVEPAVIWPLSADVQAQIEAFAPVAHIAAADGVDVERTVETMANLAAAFGVDLDTAGNSAAKLAFAQAKGDLQAAIVAKPNLITLWMAGTGTGFWTQGASSDIVFLMNMGMHVVGDNLEQAGEQSWETFATTWAADLIFNDDRESFWWSIEQLTSEVPTFSRNPAVAAGQVAPWRNTFVPSYAAFTPIMREYTEVFLSADENVIP